jgi:protein TonB
MGVIIIVALVVAGISFYDYITARRWQQVTSNDRNDIVFANRNKAYGAYTLRRDYDKRMVIIMLSVTGIIGAVYGVHHYIKNLPEEVVVEKKVDLSNMAIPAPPEDEELPPPPKEELPPPQERTVAFPPPVIVDIEVDEEIKTQEQMEDTKASTKTVESDNETWSTETGPAEEKPEVTETKEEAILEFVEEDATFNGGPAAMQQWIAKNTVYPQSAIELGEQGKVYVSFVVEPDGTISNVQVERGISEDLDREAKRVVRAMPRWKPGKNNGRAVRARCRLPIAFNLQ